MRAAVSRDELEAIVQEVHHLREEHRRAHSESGARRRIRVALLEAEREFERLLDEWVTNTATRAAWRAHLYAEGPEPTEPVPQLPLVFRGRSESGSAVEVRERPGGDYTVEVDGSFVERIEAKMDFSSTRAAHPFALDSIVFQETFSVSQDALAALGEFVAGRAPRPPWRYATELVADGLVDRYLALTPRGHRALAQSERPRKARA